MMHPRHHVGQSGTVPGGASGASGSGNAGTSPAMDFTGTADAYQNTADTKTQFQNSVSALQQSAAQTGTTVQAAAQGLSQALLLGVAILALVLIVRSK